MREDGLPDTYDQGHDGWYEWYMGHRPTNIYKFLYPPHSPRRAPPRSRTPRPILFRSLSHSLSMFRTRIQRVRFLLPRFSHFYHTHTLSLSFPLHLSINFTSLFLPPFPISVFLFLSLLFSLPFFLSLSSTLLTPSNKNTKPWRSYRTPWFRILIRGPTHERHPHLPTATGSFSFRVRGQLSRQRHDDDDDDIIIAILWRVRSRCRRRRRRNLLVDILSRRNFFFLHRESESDSDLRAGFPPTPRTDW